MRSRSSFRNASGRLCRYSAARPPEPAGERIVAVADDGVDVVDELIEVHRRALRGVYREITRYTRGQRLAIAAFPGMAFRVADILR